jgi:Protein of unknown function (DUF3644).
MRSLSSRFVDKATGALTSAVEVYNKPSFEYREETFSLLALNAWELLLKARIIKDNDNSATAIREYERRRKKDGEWSTKKYVRRNRSGNPVTISLGDCILRLDESATLRLPPEVKSNLYALIEIRDNAAHYIVASPILVVRTREVGAASVRNFLVLAKQWFSVDLSRSLSLFLPISFLAVPEDVRSIVPSSDEARLLDYLQALASAPTLPNSDFAVAVRVDLRLERSSLATASRVPTSSRPGVIEITVTEEDIRRDFPWTYTDLSHRLSDLYSDFKQGAKYHTIRKALESDKRFVNTRYLDTHNPSGTKKQFFSPNIVQEFDKHYTRKRTASG